MHHVSVVRRPRARRLGLHGLGLVPHDVDQPQDTIFTFKGVDYAVRAVEMHGDTHPVLANSWSREQQNGSTFRFTVHTGRGGNGPPPEHFEDWVLRVDGVQLPFSAAIAKGGGAFVWADSDLQEVYNDWTTSTINKIGIEEVAASELPDPRRPGTPRVVNAYTAGPYAIRVNWLPADCLYHQPNPTGYVVQWKSAAASWDNSAHVMAREVPHPSGSFHTKIEAGVCAKCSNSKKTE